MMRYLGKIGMSIKNNFVYYKILLYIALVMSTISLAASIAILKALLKAISETPELVTLFM